MIHYAVNRGAVLLRPRRQREAARRTSPTASRRSRPTRRRSRSSSSRASSSRPPVNREVTSKDIKYGFERAFSTHVPSPYATRLLRRHRRRADQAGRDQGHPGHPDARRLDDRLQAQGPERGAGLAGAGDADLDAGARGVRASKFDAKTPSTYDQYVAFTGPYMYKNDALGQAHRAHSRARASSWCATPTGTPRPTTARPTWTRSRSRRATTTPSPRRGASSAARASSRATAPRRRRSSSRRSSRNKDQIAFIPGGGYRFISMNSTIKPFDNLNVRKAVVAASDRKALQLTRGGTAAGDLATHFLPIDVPRLRGGRRRQGPGAGLPGQPERRHGAGQEVHAGGQEAGPEPADRRQRHVDGLHAVADGGLQRRPGQEDRRGRAGPVREAGLQDQVPRRPAGHALHEVLQRPGAEDRDLPERRVVQGLQRPAGGPRRGVQRQEHPAPEQLQLDAAQRPGHQQRDGEGRAAARRPRAQQGVGQHRRHGHGAGAGRSRTCGTRSPRSRRPTSAAWSTSTPPAGTWTSPP